MYCKLEQSSIIFNFHLLFFVSTEMSTISILLHLITWSKFKLGKKINTNTIYIMHVLLSWWNGVKFDCMWPSVVFSWGFFRAKKNNERNTGTRLFVNLVIWAVFPLLLTTVQIRYRPNTPAIHNILIVFGHFQCKKTRKEKCMKQWLLIAACLTFILDI